MSVGLAELGSPDGSGRDIHWKLWGAAFDGETDEHGLLVTAASPGLGRVGLSGPDILRMGDFDAATAMAGIVGLTDATDAAILFDHDNALNN